MAYCSGYLDMQQQHLQKTRDNLVQVPSSADDCTHFSMKCLSEPNSEKRKQQGLLLQFIDKAAEKNRHPFQTFVMLIGNTGVGKSSTINHLMNSELISTNNKSSETRAVTEFSRTCDVPDLGLKGLRMNIVDTPGFEDTAGIQQDACNLWAIKKFCIKYLHTANIMAFPNIILLCVKATDNRFDGKKSSLVKNLEILEAMRVIDRQNSNVVLVLTHACGVAPKNWAQTISETARNINQVLKSRLGFYAKVAHIENNFDGHNLLLRDDGTLLPDGTIQPQNLFLTIMDQLEDNGDQLGYSTFRQIYADGVRKLRFERGNSVPAKIMSTEGNRMDKDENQCFLILQDVSGAVEGLNDLRAEYERLHEENMKSKKLREEQEQILKNMMEAAEQREKNTASRFEQVVEENARLRREHTQTKEDQRLREERLEQSSQRREERFREDMQRKEESLEQERRDMKKRADREREQAKEAEKRREQLFKDEMRRQTESFETKFKDLEEQLNREKETAKEAEKRRDEEMAKMRKQNADDQRKMDDLKTKLREKELQIVPFQPSQPSTTPTDSRQKTAKKKKWYEFLGKSIPEMVINVAKHGLITLASWALPSLRPVVQAITAGEEQK